MKKIKTDKAPKTVGPYSQAVVAGDFVFCSGQIALDPFSGVLVRGGIAPQTKRVFENLKAVLQAAGARFEDVTSVNVYLTDMDNFKAMNDVYAEVFAGDMKPARVTVGVSALPKNALVEISCVAYVA